jgi:hypothetical protein
MVPTDTVEARPFKVPTVLCPKPELTGGPVVPVPPLAQRVYLEQQPAGGDRVAAGRSSWPAQKSGLSATGV